MMITDAATLARPEVAGLAPPMNAPAMTPAINSLRELYTRHWQAIFATAYRLTGNAADAEDALQAVFVRLLAHTEALDETRSPEGYLRRAAVNASIDLIRRRRNRVEVELAESRAANGDSPVDRERLRAAIGQLEPAAAELFVMCYVEGYTYEELAAMYDTERGTIASRLHRIRQELRDRLSK